MFCSTSISTWNWSSESSSCSTRVGRTIEDSRDAAHRVGDALPLLLFFRKLPVPRLRQFVELRLAIVLGAAPGRGDEALLLEAVQSRVEGPLIDLQHVAGNLLNAQRNAPPVPRSGSQRAEDQEVQSTLKEVGFLRHRAFL
jgi:hypothetical protein